MREYKFRAWHTDAEMMLYEHKVGDVFRWKEDGQPIEIMQYSGSRDQKGEGIYDGDIAWVTHMLVENIPTYKAVVVWDKWRFALKNLEPNKANFMFSYQNLDPFGLIIEVIGNIHEHPHLLEQGEKE